MNVFGGSMSKAIRASLVIALLACIAVFYQNCGQEFQTIGYQNIGSNTVGPAGFTATTDIQISRKNYSNRLVSVEFNEDVTGFDVSDLLVQNAIISDFQGSGSSYSFRAELQSYGTVSVSLAGDAVINANGDLNPGFQLIQFDHQPPAAASEAYPVFDAYGRRQKTSTQAVSHRGHAIFVRVVDQSAQRLECVLEIVL